MAIANAAQPYNGQKIINYADIVKQANQSNTTPITNWSINMPMNNNQAPQKQPDPIAANINANPNYKPPSTVVSEAVASTAGNNNVATNTNNNVNLERDAYNRGVKAAEDTFKASTSNMMTAEDFTRQEEQIRNAKAEAIRAKVRAAINEGVNKQNDIIRNAPAQFVNPMNNASFQGANNARAIDERMVAMGLGRSGSNVTAQTSNNNQTAANINDLENAKAKVISDAQSAIANLQASGSLQEVAMVQEAAARSLERLQNQINIIDNRKNEQAMAIFNNANNALKTNYDIGANEKQLGMQQQGIDNSVNQFDRTFNANEYWKNKDYDAQQAQQTWENTFKEGTYNYQKERDKVADTQFGKQYQMQLDKFEWDKNPDNPAVKQQIINNTIADIQKQRMENPNSVENSILYVQGEKAKKELADLMAISPEMKVKEFNANLNAIYANINQSNASAAASGRSNRGGDNISIADISPTGKPLTPAEKNQYYSEAYKTIKNLSVADAKKALETKRQEIESLLGNEQYVRLYNDVLAAAIDAGQATKYNEFQ